MDICEFSSKPNQLVSKTPCKPLCGSIAVPPGASAEEVSEELAGPGGEETVVVWHNDYPLELLENAGVCRSTVFSGSRKDFPADRECRKEGCRGVEAAVAGVVRAPELANPIIAHTPV
ncbi:malto-oligosyltrehalose synthase [Striga asiatica]|uniref:Malto-oligosyltrehalose synthase n=1 Tax=Striga asiatica TaxID=4170 RepID=A0A5A7PY54_STRAF|nr:malto-oligosyltrehalose synthase [Striga asiatica]